MAKWQLTTGLVGLFQGRRKICKTPATAWQLRPRTNPDASRERRGKPHFSWLVRLSVNNEVRIPPAGCLNTKYDIIPTISIHTNLSVPLPALTQAVE